MAKSKETFSKKEKEKKKLKKRLDKQEKKEERQANAKDGNNLDEMLAYVDENGNITNTPPDPKKKKVINVEDIQIGVAKMEPMDESELIRTGVVTMFNESKGYGFIKDLVSQESVFVHVNTLNVRIKENDKVTFEVEMGHKGKNATNVNMAVAETAPKKPEATVKQSEAAPKESATAPKESATAPKESATASKESVTAPKESATASKESATASKESEATPKQTS